MPTPPPDPTGRPSSAKRAPAGESPPGTPAGQGDAAKASTNSHHPAAPLSEVLASPAVAGTPPAPPAIGSDVLRALDDPAADPNLAALENTDDAPTVITRGIGDQPPPPVPLNVLASDPPQLAGRRLGNYELIEAVGAGGMAAVLKARDCELGRVVALKILPPSAARDPESVTRFKQEARAAALLDHENIARVYACGEDQGLYFIAFEFVEGVNLRQMIERRRTIPPAEAVRYMIQVAAGLAHAAERGVVHRDIKPSNILITPDGRAKIVDMGLARQLEMPANGGVTQSGVTLGTFDYISPEQALDPRRADVRSDIYSLGCTFYHALTGRPPVPEGTAAKKLHAHQHADPLDPREIKPDIPDELVVILARMMAKDPARRYQAPEELIAHLKGLAEPLHLSPEAVGQDSVVRAVRARRSLHPPQLRVGWLVGVAAVVVAVAAFALSTGDPGPASNPPPWAGDARNGKAATPTPSGGGGKSGPAAPAEDGLVRTAEQLAAKVAEAAADGPTEIRLAPGEIDLTHLPDPVVFRGKELKLKGSVSPPTVLRVNAVPATAPPAVLPAGTFSALGADAVSVTGVRFEAVPPADEDVTDSAWAAFAATDVGHVALADCVFAAPEAARAEGLGAVRVTRGGGTVHAERCAFAPAAFALWLPDSCRATVLDCGFGPHDAAVRVGDARAVAAEGPAQAAEVALERSSFLLDPTSAVVTNLTGGTGPGVEVTAEYCVFAATTAPDPLASLPGVSAFLPPPAQPVLVRAQAQAGEVSFTGNRKNAYFGVAALSVPADREVKYYTFRQCQEKQFPIADATAAELPQRPWAELNPVQQLARADLWRAFGLKLEEPALAELFIPDRQVRVLGAQFHNENFVPARRAYPNPRLVWPPEPPRSAVSPPSNQLVWYPGAPEGQPLPKGTSADLAKLLKAARPGDEILIRHNGLLNLDATVKLDKRAAGGADLQVTFRPDEGFTPVLAAPGGAELDQALFRLMSGRVVFQKVQFLLKPNKPRDGQTVAAVEVLGGDSCEFKDCVFTLAEEDASKAVAVLVPDPKPVMAMEGSPPPVPHVRFERCVIRGKGRGVWVKASRAVDVAVTQSLTAIDGPFFFAEPGGAMAPGARSQLQLNRVTAFLGGPLVEMHGGKVGAMRVSGLVPLDVRADACLFAGVPAAGKPLVELDGVDPDEAMKTVPWQVQSANRYANFDDATAVMLVRPAAEGTTPKMWSWDQWVTFAAEPAAGAGKRVGKVVFENAPAGLAALSALKPADAAVKSADFDDLRPNKPLDVGVTADLPTPAPPE